MTHRIIVLTQPRSGSTFFTSTIQSMMTGSLQDLYRASEWYLLSELEPINNIQVESVDNVRIQTQEPEETTVPLLNPEKVDRVEVTMDFDGRLERFINNCGSEYNKLIVAEDLIKACQEYHFDKDIIFRVFKSNITNNFEYFEYLKTVTDINIIHLVRENTLDVLVSRRRAHESNLWHAFINIDERVTVEIDLKLLSDELVKQEYLTWFVDTNYPNALKVKYSDLIGNFENTIKSVSDFCGLSGDYVPSGFKKINQLHKRDIIKNYDEVAKFLSGTKNEWMLYH